MSGIRYSIVITCYNQQEFIKDAIESVLSQGPVSKEVIVVDDGSRDGSLEVLKRYEASVELISLSINCGAIEARNRGAALASGEYLIFLDGDDLLTPWALDVHDRVIAERHPTTIVSAGRVFKGLLPVFHLSDVPKRLEFVEYKSLMAKDRQCGWYTGGFVVSRRAFNDVGGWSKGIFQLDLMDLAAKLGYSGNSILVCSPYTMLYRMHSANSVHNVLPFLLAAHRIMDREWSGQYPGGRRRLFERCAWYGGMIVIWTKRGLRTGLYKNALKLAACGWFMIIAGVVRRCVAWIRGRRPIETIELIKPHAL